MIVLCFRPSAIAALCSAVMVLRDLVLESGFGMGLTVSHATPGSAHLHVRIGLAVRRSQCLARCRAIKASLNPSWPSSTTSPIPQFLSKAQRLSTGSDGTNSASSGGTSIEAL